MSTKFANAVDLKGLESKRARKYKQFSLIPYPVSITLPGSALWPWPPISLPHLHLATTEGLPHYE